MTSTLYSQRPTDRRSCQTTSSGECSNRLGRPQTFPWVGSHAFRHACASILFAEGRNAVQVQRWLGHHSAAFTLATYVHLLDGDLGEPLRIPQTVRNDAK
jgi:integrase